MKYYNLTKADKELQEKLIRKYSHRIISLPKGRLTYKRKYGRKYYYLNNDKYLGAKDSNLIRDLKTRAYLEKAIKIMTTNVKSQEKLLSKYKPYDFASINDSLSPAYQSDYKIAAKDPTNEFSFGSAPIHRTSFGLYTRSRAEAFIAEMLHTEGIKFTYEEPLDLITRDGNFITLHPDFTIHLSPYEKKYWEHAGLFNEEEYRNNFFSKLDSYFYNDITIPTNLIITIDSKDGAFDGLGIQNIIKSLL